MRRILPYGPTAMLAEFETIAEVMGAAAAVSAAAVPGVVDVVPAARTVLVTYLPGADVGAVTELLARRVSVPQADGPRVVVPVCYDGADLADVAARCGLSTAQVIDLHSAAEYHVAFCGFMPGFAYLVGLDEHLHLPRRSSPRASVPAGSVAIAGEFSAVYPSASPGGWHLLGTTDVVLWDELSDPPALLAPGTRVRFEAR